MKKVASCYCRYSSDKQQEQSIDFQLEMIEKFCQKNEIELAERYIDKAVSGTSDNRENFQRMIDESRYASWNYLIVYDYSRLSRNVEDQMFYQKILKNNGVLVISVKEKYDSNSPEGSFFNLITAGMNEYYSKNLAKRSFGGVMQNAKKGLVIGGKPPLGFDVGPDKKYVINEREAEAIRIIFDKTVEGWSYRKIADHLNQLGYKNKRGKTFRALFTDTLTNEKYKGEYVFNKTEKKKANGSRNNHAKKPESDIVRIPGGIPQIVDSETFDKVQSIVKKRKLNNYRGQYKTKYLLTGFLECKHCGYAFMGNTSFHKEQLYPRVTYRHSRSGHHQCRVKDILVKQLDDWVMESLIAPLSKISNASTYLKVINSEIKKAKQTNQLEQELIEKEIVNKQNQVKNLVERMTSEQSISPMIIEEINYIKTQIDAMNENRKHLISIADNLKNISLENIKKFQRSLKQGIKNTFNDQEKKKLLEAIVDKIVISNEEVCFYTNLKYLNDGSIDIPILITSGNREKSKIK